MITYLSNVVLLTLLLAFQCDIYTDTSKQSHSISIRQVKPMSDKTCPVCNLGRYDATLYERTWNYSTIPSEHSCASITAAAEGKTFRPLSLKEETLSHPPQSLQKEDTLFPKCRRGNKTICQIVSNIHIQRR